MCQKFDCKAWDRCSIKEYALDCQFYEKMKKVTEELEWKNIDHEIYRVYQFPGGNFIRIDGPKLLNVSESGGHRILDWNDKAHYIPSGWIHLYWETNDENAFRF